MGKHFKEAFREIAVEPSPEVWQSGSSRIPAAATGSSSLWRWIGGGLAVAVLTTAMVLWLNNSDEQQPVPRQQPAVSQQTVTGQQPVIPQDSIPAAKPVEKTTAVARQQTVDNQEKSSVSNPVPPAGRPQSAVSQKENPPRSISPVTPVISEKKPTPPKQKKTQQKETLTLKNNNNESPADSVLGSESPKISFSVDPVVCFGEDALLKAQGGVSYRWNTGDVQSAVKVSPVYNTTYTVTVTDINGKTYVHDFQVVVSRECTAVNVPSAFSPNGDGVNDVFKVYGEGVTNFQMQIFDRMGRVVFSSNDINRGWDGTDAGEILPVGVYVYTLSYRDGRGVNRIKKGQITIVR